MAHLRFRWAPTIGWTSLGAPAHAPHECSIRCPLPERPRRATPTDLKGALFALVGRSQHRFVELLVGREGRPPLCAIKKWSGRPDSNRRSPRPKRGAIPGFATPRL